MCIILLFSVAYLVVHPIPCLVAGKIRQREKLDLGSSLFLDLLLWTTIFSSTSSFDLIKAQLRGVCFDLSSSGGMNGSYSNASASSSSSLDSSIHDTEDDQTIATILAEEEKVKFDRRLGKRLSHLDSIPHTPRVNGEIPDVNDATQDHERLSARLATYDLSELQIEGDGNCQFRAIADQLFRNPEYHKHVRKQVIKQLKHHKKLYEAYVPMKYRRYLRKMKKTGEWGDHLTLQAAADRFGAKICVVTSFRDTCYIEILPKDGNPTRELWLSFWSEVHYNSLYASADVPTRTPRKKHWLLF